MKKAVVFLAVLLLLMVVPMVGQAADLQAGWYAKIITVNVYGYDYQGMPSLIGGGYFYNSPTGQYGPFHVGGPQARIYDERDISVPSSVANVGADQSLVLPLSIGMSVGSQIAYISISWATCYQADSMCLALWRQRSSGTDSLVWQQSLSGTQGNTTHVAYNTVLEGPYYFKVDVVPEPSAFACLAVLTLGLFRIARIRRN